jgi:hypothetical protein
MKAKTLLIAAAALAAGVISSQAQVYSQNIVGYVNLTATANQYNLFNNPLTIGVTNGANEVFGTNLPNGTQLFQWTGLTYTISTYDASIGADANNWYNGDETATAPTPVLLPGQGYFLLPGTTFTNTYVGTVAVNVGSFITNTATANQYNLLGSYLPVAGAVSNSIVNFFPPNGTQLFQWTGLTYNVSTYDASIGADANNWYNGDETATAPTPVINVGDGFFVLPGTTYTWVQGL